MSGGRTAMLGAMGLQPMRLRRRGAGAAAPEPVAVDAFDGSERQRGHPLLAPILRAAGVSPRAGPGFDWAGWGASIGLPAPQRLAGEPGLKRELWRRIRRLRRDRRG